jgi:hypothetical protein
MLRDVRSMGTTDEGIRRLLLPAARLFPCARFARGTDECVRPYRSLLSAENYYLMVNVRVFDVPPPGVGFLTARLAVPADATLAAGT